MTLWKLAVTALLGAGLSFGQQQDDLICAKGGDAGGIRPAAQMKKANGPVKVTELKRGPYSIKSASDLALVYRPYKAEVLAEMRLEILNDKGVVIWSSQPRFTRCKREKNEEVEVYVLSDAAAAAAGAAFKDGNAVAVHGKIMQTAKAADIQLQRRQTAMKLIATR